MRAVVREVLMTIILALLIFVAIRAVVHNFEVKGLSMEPSLHDGQFIIVNKASYWLGTPKRGDIVVFNRPSLKHGIIHRVIGLQGELIEIKNGEPYVNGEKLGEPYIQGHSVSASPQKVPDGSYFIVGDNRTASSWDIVPRRDIIGKAWLSYWPISEWGLVPSYFWESEAEDNKESDIGASFSKAFAIELTMAK